MVSIDDNTVTSTRGDTLETKIIKAVFDGDRYAVTAKRTRTDYGQVLEFVDVVLPDTFECIFSNSAASSGVGKKQIGSAQRVLIPDEYLATGQAIYAWVLVHDGDDDGRHMYNVKIPVVGMPDTSPEEPTPVEQSVISQAIAALNTAVDTTSQKAQEASDSADRAEQAAEGVEGYAERAESAQQAAESARDRTVEAETSAMASAATATEKASEAISSATTASQSALTAESASESASASEQIALGYAESAQDSARQARDYSAVAISNANSASQNAQTASNKASEASQSASTASQAKTDAESAKTASETAQTASESARDGAVSAKTDAESARDEAQSIVNGITGKVEQIDSNTERIESLEDDRYKPYPTDSASGSIASFPDGADDIPLKSCIVHVEPVQEGSGDPSPDNVRPISGFTGCEVQRTGKNLFDKSKAIIGKFINISMQEITNGAKSHSELIPVKPSTAYFMNGFGNSGYFAMLAVDANKQPIVWYGGVSKDAPFTTTTPSNCRYVYLNFNADQLDTMAFYEGSENEGYIPYHGNTYPITFPSEAGTVYGGYIDVLRGVMIVEFTIIDLNAVVTNVQHFSTYDSWYSNSLDSLGIADIKSNSSEFVGYCDTYPIYAYSYLVHNKIQYGVAIRSDANRKAIYVNTDLTSNVAPTGHVVLKLAEPITYQLTPQEIKTLLGQNNLWADCGDVSVEYRADTKLYIEKLTQPEEYDMIADSAINSGQFFMVGNSLYRALANIASGATITVGTNAQRVSLSDALNLVNA